MCTLHIEAPMYMYTLVWNCLSFWKLSMGEHRAIFHSSRLLKVCWKEIPNHCSFQQIHTQYCGQCPWQLVGELLFSMHESPLIVHRHQYCPCYQVRSSSSACKVGGIHKACWVYEIKSFSKVPCILFNWQYSDRFNNTYM